MTWLKPQTAQAAGDVKLFPQEDYSGPRDCGHLMTFLLSYWTQMEEQADCGMRA